MTIIIRNQGYRDHEINLKDFDTVLKDHRKMRKDEAKLIKESSQTRRGGGKGKKKATQRDDSDPDDDDDRDEPQLPRPAKGDKIVPPAKAPTAAEQARKLKAEAAKAEARAFMESRSDLDTLDEALKDAQAQMAIQPFTREIRRSKNYVFRILTTCGWRWNVMSNYKARDFWQVALSAVLESIIVPEYRKYFLEKCPEAHEFRLTIQEFFMYSTDPVPRITQGPDGELTTSDVKSWDFADAIQPDPDLSLPIPKGYGYDDLDKDLANSIDVKSKSLEDIKKLVTGMMKNPYLACSQDGVATGTLESSAYYHLNALLKVSRPPLIPLVPHPFASRPTDHGHKFGSHGAHRQGHRRPLRPYPSRHT